MKSETTGALFAALAKTQASIGAAQKNSKNPHLKNSYADLGSIWAAWREHGPAAGLAVIQTPTPENTLVTTLGHESGEWISSEIPIIVGDGRGINAAQAYGSALSYARRYALAAIVGIYAGDDDDGAGSGQSAPMHQADPPPPADPMQAKLRSLFATMRKKNIDPDAFKAGLQARHGLTSSKDITPALYGKIMSTLEAIADEGADILADQATKQEGQP